MTLASHKNLLHIYTAAACFNVRNPKATDNKGISMKRYALIKREHMMSATIIFAGILVASSAHAGVLNYDNATSAETKTNTANRPFANLRGQITVPVGGLAPSITMPTTTSTLHLYFTDSTALSGTLVCFDGGVSPSNICGSAPPTGTISNTAWQPVPAPSSPFNPMRLLPLVSGTTNTALTTMYVSNSTAVTQTMHYAITQER